MAQLQTEPPQIDGDSEFGRFWNEILGAEFNRFRHFLVGGADPSQRSAVSQTAGAGG